MLRKSLNLLLILTLLSGAVLGQETIVLEDSVTKSGPLPGYRWKDSYLSNFRPYRLNSPLINFNSSIISTKILSRSGEINVFEQADNINSVTPQSLNFNEYSSIQNAMVRKSLIREYEQMADGNSTVSGRGLNPLLKSNKVLDQLFGGKIPDFRPNGFVSVDLKAGSRTVNNPNNAIQFRTQPVFDLDQQIAINFDNLISDITGGAKLPGRNRSTGNSSTNGASSGTESEFPNPLTEMNPGLGGYTGPREKIKIDGNYDTKAAFNFENKTKIDFRNNPEDIIQSIEAGNVSMPNRAQLIPGVENLFGAKVGLRFGKLDLTTVVAQQRSNIESITINGGNIETPFEIRVDSYEENKHFFLGHFFRNNYENSLLSLPMVLSGVRITRVEAYVTNRTNNVSAMRNIIGITDLGEETTEGSTNTQPADNEARTRSKGIFTPLNNDPTFRDSDNTQTALANLNLKNGLDYEVLKGAKKLSENEYKYNAELGYISLLTPLRNDEILAVAYEFTFNGQKYQVGELTEDYSGRESTDVIMMKLLKSSNIRNNLDTPMWDLMMKNIYSLGLNQVSAEGFKLRVIYKDDKTGVDSPFLQDVPSLANTPLIELLRLDQLNFNNDPQKDGNFDYVPNVTIEEQYGKLIFPVLEPFGSFLNDDILGEESQLIKDKYVFNELYEGTLTDAQQITLKNKFFFKGSLQSENREIMLPLGTSPSSVKVYSGGTQLQQGSDYIVDSQFGSVRITNQSILNSSRQIRIDYERPDLFTTQIRRMLGVRADYAVNRNLRLGGTFMNLKEQTPAFLSRAAIGNEPVNNSIFGLDFNYKKESIALTRLLDKLPIVSAKEPSSIILNGEIAQLKPGVNNDRVNGYAMIDDFEAAKNVNDLARQPRLWKLGSTPSEYSEATATNPYGYNNRRAKISAYSIDGTLYQTSQFGSNLISAELAEEAGGNIYTKSYLINDIFKGLSVPLTGLQTPLGLFDISYFPAERGMYNYNNDLGTFINNPKENFGSIMRGLTNDADFDNANIEYLEFWLLDPFADEVVLKRGENGVQNTTGGKLTIQLGNVSEDVIPDNQNNFENGLSTGDGTYDNLKATQWGFAPTKQYINDGFDNLEETRSRQDVGLEGLSNAEEKEFEHIKTFLSSLNAAEIGQELFDKIQNDPSGDDFKFFLNETHDNDNNSLLARYKDYMGMENNSPVGNEQDILSETYTNLSDKEDLNQDNTISEIESYYSYEIDLKPNELQKGRGFIADKIEGSNGESFYLFRIPIDKPTDDKDITGFKSIRFVRIVLEEWEQPVVLRMPTMQLVGNSYRKYDDILSSEEEINLPNTYDAGFISQAVNVEENGCLDSNPGCKPDGIIPYVVPPGFIRDRDFSQQNANMVFNEQSISLTVTDLKDGDARGVYKNTELDLNMYKRLQLFIHSESEQNTTAGGFIRLGTDLKQNYYEIQVPQLENTIYSSTLSSEAIWIPTKNSIDVGVDDLRALKVNRNKNGATYDLPYEENLIGPDGQNYIIKVKGNPDLSSIQTLMLGILNPEDGGGTISNTLWMDELRTYGFDQKSGYSAIASADIKLSDIGTLSLSGYKTTYGYGGVQDRISARTRDYTTGFGVATALNLDRFLPYTWGLQIPFFANYDKMVITPEFDPLNPDLNLEDDVLSLLPTQTERDLYKEKVIDQSVRKGFNFSDVRKLRTNPEKKSRVYDVENLSFSYSQSEVNRSNVTIADYVVKENKGGVAYVFSPEQKLWEPNKDKEKYDKRFLYWLKDFNLNLKPSLVGFRGDFRRSYSKSIYWENNATETNPYNLDTTGVAPNVIKYFLTSKAYNLNWDFTQALSMNYSAIVKSIIDEDPLETEARNIKQDFHLASVFNKARTQSYTQNIDFNYQLPLDKFFLTDWVNADGRYSIGYNYKANSFGLKEILDDGTEDGTEGELFGNYLENNREWNLTGNFDLIKLYNKISFLKKANEPKEEVIRYTRAPGDYEFNDKEPSSIAKSLARVLMAVRGINFSITNYRGTVMPGFSGKSGFFGTFGQGSLPFVLGSQRYKDSPLTGEGWLNTAEQNGWLTKAQTRNDPFIQDRKWKYEYSTNVEPWEGFRLQIKGQVSRGDDYQVLYRADENGVFNSSNNVRNGNYSTSFWSFRTLFEKVEKDPLEGARYSYSVFDKMNEFRPIVTEHLNSNFTDGESEYSSSSQDVLIQAFFGAYSGKDSVQLKKFLNKKFNKESRTSKSPFIGSIPLPNWRLDYGGIEKLAGLNAIFNSITLSHSYTSTYDVGNYTSSLDYQTDYLMNLLVSDYPLGNLVNDFSQATTTGISTISTYSPVFIMSTISLNERFSPLIGLNFVTKGNFSGTLEFNKERRASLNLSNIQIAEYHSNSIVFQTGIRKKNVVLPFRDRSGNRIVLKNDLDFSIRCTLNDILALQRKLDGEATVTQGNRNIQIRPQVQYKFNERFSGSLYVEFLENSPYNTLTYYQKSTIGGVNMRFNLND